MQLGIARSVNSSAIRLYQLKKAYDHYISQSHPQEFILECLHAEMEDLKKEIGEMEAEARWDKYNRT